MAKKIKVNLETDDKKLNFRIYDNRKYVIIYNKENFLPVRKREWKKVVKFLKTKN